MVLSFEECHLLSGAVEDQHVIKFLRHLKNSAEDYALRSYKLRRMTASARVTLVVDLTPLPGSYIKSPEVVQLYLLHVFTSVHI